ncbi:MAG: hypothetical protein AB8E15_00885 [Bdellovibrionales bacterium]
MRWILIVLFSCNLFAVQQETRSKRFFDSYKKNRASTRDRIPTKWRVLRGQTKPVSRAEVLSPFQWSDLESKEYVVQKNQFRSDFICPQCGFLKPPLKLKSEWGGNDKAENLVDIPAESMLVNIFEIQKQGLQQAKLAELPWSDDYWAIRAGTLGARYSDLDFMSDLNNWKSGLDYISNYLPTSNVIEKGNLDFLSPAEKYDLLIGDTKTYSLAVDDENYKIQGSLNYKMWEDGSHYWNQKGEVESWMGICHGWAAAAYMLDAPKKAVDVEGSLGHDIRFYPADIKALSSLLWANTRNPVKFLGGRCNSETPDMDENGRVIDPDCVDTNPGTWHKVVVNQIGLAKRSFILDANFDYQVWNQPVYSYSYTYFNPIDKTYYHQLDSKNKLDSAVIKIDDFNDDPYKAYRSPKAKYIVGINMELAYVSENQPNQLMIDLPSEENIVRVDYFYDLELDGDFNIVGGEWYQNIHPDFLWTPHRDSKAMAYGDYYLDKIIENGSVSRHLNDDEFKRKMIQQSSLRGQPLGKIVRELIRMAN